MIEGARFTIDCTYFIGPENHLSRDVLKKMELIRKLKVLRPII